MNFIPENVLLCIICSNSHVFPDSPIDVDYRLDRRNCRRSKTVDRRLNCMQLLDQLINLIWFDARRVPGNLLNFLFSRHYITFNIWVRCFLWNFKCTHTNYFTHTLEDAIFIQCWKFTSSQIYEPVCVFKGLLSQQTCNDVVSAYGCSNHLQLNCLHNCNRLFGLTQKKAYNVT